MSSNITLPYELISHIIQLSTEDSIKLGEPLENRPDLLNFCQVNKFFASISKPLLLRYLTSKDFTLEPSLLHSILNGICTAKEVKTLSWKTDFVGRIEEDLMVEVLENISGIQHLEFLALEPSELILPSLPKMFHFESLQKLETLTILDTQLSRDEILLPSSLHSITTSINSDFTSVSEFFFKLLLTSPCQIDTFKIMGLLDYSPEFTSFIRIYFEHCSKQIKTLSIETCNMYLADFLFPLLTSLEHLTLEPADEIPKMPGIIRILERLPPDVPLETLNLSEFILDLDTLPPPHLLTQLIALPQLNKLKLLRCPICELSTWQYYNSIPINPKFNNLYNERLDEYVEECNKKGIQLTFRTEMIDMELKMYDRKLLYEDWNEVGKRLKKIESRKREVDFGEW